MELSSLSELLYKMGDVAAGKISLEDAFKELADKDKKEIKQLYDKCKEFVARLKNNVKKSVKEEYLKNELEAKYDMSSAVSVEVNGKTLYMGLKPKEKLSLWKKLKNRFVSNLRDTADLADGKMSLADFAQKRYKNIEDNMKENNPVYRKGASVMAGVEKGLKRTLKELRGTKAQEKSNLENPYNKLEPERLRVAMGTAYMNIVRMEHMGNGMSPEEKDKGLAEINKIMKAAQGRFPDVGAVQSGSYFTDPKLRSTEAQLFAYMKADALRDGDKNLNVARYDAWRQGKNFEMPLGNKTLREYPYNNIELYTSRMSLAEQSRFKGLYTADQHLYNPLKTARNVMTENDVKIAQAQLKGTRIR